jgi:hypothetical protein
VLGTLLGNLEVQDRENINLVRHTSPIALGVAGVSG